MCKLNQYATAGLACAIWIALGAACGDDSSSMQPVETSGTGGGQAGRAATAGTSSGTAGGAAGSSAGRGGVAGTGTRMPTAGRGTGAAGRMGGAAGSMDEDDAGVKPGTAGSGAAGSAGAAGAAGAAGGKAGAGGSTAGAGGGAAGAAGSGMGAGATFTEVYAIFMQSCAGSTCHVMATRPGEGLSMANKMTAYMNLVGVNAGACSGEKRVVAGDPEKSELLHTLEHTMAGSCRNTPRMPDDRPMLPADQIAKVRSWIMAGALNN